VHKKQVVALFLKRLSRFRGVSDGAKVTLLEFVYHFWSEDKKIPSYTELCKTRGVVRSTIQKHVEELEESGLLVSVRLPGNRKRYRLDPTVLEEVRVTSKKEPESPKTFKVVKHVSKYTTVELCRYFYFLLGEMTGESRKHNRMDYNLMKLLHKQFGSSELIKMMEQFKRVHRRKGLPFSISAFGEHADRYKDNEGVR